MSDAARSEDYYDTVRIDGLGTITAARRGSPDGPIVGTFSDAFMVDEPVARHADGTLNTDPVCICDSRLAEYHPCAVHWRQW